MNLLHPSSGAKISGYEIHIGETRGPDCERNWLEIKGNPEGACSLNGLVRGCYVHGLFAADQFRRAFVEELGTQSDGFSYDAVVEDTLERLANHLEEYLYVDAMFEDLISA